MAEDFVKVAKASDLSPGQCKVVSVGSEQVLLANVGGEYVAVDDTCTHAFASLSMGKLTDEEVVCPLHGSVFNVKTGEILSPPADEPLAVYPVRVEGDDILVGPPG